MQYDTKSDIYRRAFVRYLRKGTPIDISMKAAGMPEASAGQYAWRTMRDVRVRPLHGLYEGRTSLGTNRQRRSSRQNADVPLPSRALLRARVQDGEDTYFAEALAEAERLKTQTVQLGVDSPTNWRLGDNKNAREWAKQMRKREWDKSQITDTIRKGVRHPASNLTAKPSPRPATRYQLSKDRYVVVDNRTRDVVQISGKGHTAMDFEE